MRQQTAQSSDLTASDLENGNRRAATREVLSSSGLPLCSEPGTVSSQA